MSSRCKACGGDTAVRDSRPTAGGLGVIRRRRACLNRQCGERFTTLEFSADDLERLISARVMKRLSQVRDVVRVVNDAMQGISVKGAGSLIKQNIFAPTLIEEMEAFEREALEDARPISERQKMRADPADDTLKS